MLETDCAQSENTLSWNSCYKWLSVTNIRNLIFSWKIKFVLIWSLNYNGYRGAIISILRSVKYYFSSNNCSNWRYLNVKQCFFYSILPKIEVQFRHKFRTIFCVRCPRILGIEWDLLEGRLWKGLEEFRDLSKAMVKQRF